MPFPSSFRNKKTGQVEGGYPAGVTHHPSELKEEVTLRWCGVVWQAGHSGVSPAGLIGLLLE